MVPAPHIASYSNDAISILPITYMMQRITPILFRALTLALLATLMCVSARAQQNAPPADPSAPLRHNFGQRLSLPGVPNFGEITPNLFRGAQPSREGVDALAKMGVGIVINLRGDRDSEREEVSKVGMLYISIPSHCSHMASEDIATVLHVLRDNPGKKIFIHCQFGVDRTGMVVAAYRMAEQGWTAGESLREMEAFGYTLKHKMICPGLTAFESNFPRAFANNSAFENLRPVEGASSTLVSPAASSNARN
ncbi:MAG: dual specificity protein phosphatase family protein [Candidatus Acidiferrales bacterium]